MEMEKVIREMNSLAKLMDSLSREVFSEMSKEELESFFSASDFLTGSLEELNGLAEDRSVEVWD